MTTWAKLIRENQWDVITYHLGPPVRPGGTGLDPRACPRALLKAGQAYRVRWPDGSISLETMTTQIRHATHSDHGHQNTVRQELYGFSPSVRGIAAWVEVSDVELLPSDVEWAEKPGAK